MYNNSSSLCHEPDCAVQLCPPGLREVFCMICLCLCLCSSRFVMLPSGYNPNAQQLSILAFPEENDSLKKITKLKDPADYSRLGLVVSHYESAHSYFSSAEFTATIPTLLLMKTTAQKS
ncbi:fatty acyl-ACP thioesterase A [Dendrobium catenatum]|uniref:Fatty acyl-ACP thioesterase A n=1 Tax=Dendrobium catenatum TaxID=906689 RepID=A0A2I0X9Y8_9ASPA|nr:fatty acyl-ACP thioesterase A [Dendrobium catenatum]